MSQSQIVFIGRDSVKGSGGAMTGTLFALLFSPLISYLQSNGTLVEWLCIKLVFYGQLKK